MPRKLFYLLFFLSGFSALVYELVWARQLGLVFGNTVYAISTVLTIFFAGLALGSFLFGRVADNANEKRIKIVRINANSILFIYALLELGIGLYAALTPWIFKLIEGAQISLSQQFNPSYSGFSLLTFGLCFLGLIFPTILMGGTLPVVSRFLAQSREKSGSVMGNLYGLNTLGGVVGVFLAGFFLIRYLGVRETIWLAAFINIVVGGVVLYLSRINANRKQIIANERMDKHSVSSFAPIRSQFASISILAVFTITGFAALALEVLWTRVLILVFGSSTYAFTIILAVFLLGIALGSFLASKFLLDRRNLILWLVGLQVFLGLGVILLIPLFPKLPFFFLDFLKSNPNFSNNLWASIIISFLMIFPLTTIMGLIFPLGIRLVTENFAILGKNLGKLYGFNTLGGVLGAFIAGFVFIPLLDLQRGILLAGFLYLFSSLLLSLILNFKGELKIAILAINFFILSLFIWLPGWNKHIFSSGIFLYFYQYLGSRDVLKDMSKDELLYYKDGLSATVAVKKDGKNLYLKINGKTDASSEVDKENFLLVGHLPMLLHPDPKRVLVIGLGSGITLGAVEQYPLEKVDLVEIEPAVIEAASFFAEENTQALKDKRLNLIIGDGRHFLLTTSNKYDVISSQPSNLWVKGNANLFTREYYQLVKAHLQEGGLFLQWVQSYSLDKENLKTAIGTFQTVFPEMSLWNASYSPDFLMIGRREENFYDFNALKAKFEEEKIKEDLERINIDQASDILAFYLLSGKELRNFTKGSSYHTDNNPILEFITPFSLGLETIGENFEAFVPFLNEPYSLFENLSSFEKREVVIGREVTKDVFKSKAAFAKGEFNQAIFYLEEAQKKRSENRQLKMEAAKIYFGQARYLNAQRNLQGAKQSLIKAIEFDANYFKAHLNLGAIYFQEGDIAQAAQEWAIAKELDPESPEVNQNLKLLDQYIQ